MIGQRLPVADENSLFIKGTFTIAPVALQSPFEDCFELATLQPPVLPFATAAQERAASAKVIARQQGPADISAALQRRLDQAQVPANQRRDYEKWVRFYLDICTKYGDSPALPTSLGPFLTKLAAKNQSVGQRSQAFGPLHPLLGGEFGVASLTPLRLAPNFPT